MVNTKWINAVKGYYIFSFHIHIPIFPDILYTWCDHVINLIKWCNCLYREYRHITSGGVQFPPFWNLQVADGVWGRARHPAVSSGHHSFLPSWPSQTQAKLHTHATGQPWLGPHSAPPIPVPSPLQLLPPSTTKCPLGFKGEVWRRVDYRMTSRIFNSSQNLIIINDLDRWFRYIFFLMSRTSLVTLGNMLETLFNG
jgi:hypothetical protein